LDTLPEWAGDAIEQFRVASDEALGVSDRACAIVMASALENMLRIVLVKRMPETEVSLGRIVREGQLHSLILHARWVGAVSRRLSETLLSINEVRNGFGHGVLKQPTFDSPELASRVGNLKQPVEVLNASGHLLSKRDEFLAACAAAYIELLMIGGYVARIEPEFPGLHSELQVDMAAAPSMEEMAETMRQAHRDLSESSS